MALSKYIGSLWVSIFGPWESILGLFESTFEFESRFWSFGNPFKLVSSFSKTSVLTSEDKFQRSFAVAKATLKYNAISSKNLKIYQKLTTNTSQVLVSGSQFWVSGSQFWVFGIRF